MLAMTLHPECQVNAQLEIDELLGGSRLPAASDRKSMPYLECILLECYRWGGNINFYLSRTTTEYCHTNARWLSAAPLGTNTMYPQPLNSIGSRFVPSGIPHRALADDVYKGMLIPKGSIVIVNTRYTTSPHQVYQQLFFS